MKVDYEARFHTALRRIMAYMTPSQLRRAAEKQYGLSYDEALEYAYENVRGEAAAALKGYRRKKPAAALAPHPARPEKEEDNEKNDDLESRVDKGTLRGGLDLPQRATGDK